MPQCKHYKICVLEANPGEDLCILHSQDPEKDKEEFDKAFAAHRQKNGHNFQHFVFPGHADFSGAAFAEWASFFYATFNGRADFSHTKFSGGADFSNVTFTKSSDFLDATFDKGAKFSHTTFTEGADFGAATFRDWVDFSYATCAGKSNNFYDVRFYEEASFLYATFTGKAGFGGTWFTQGADFSGAMFSRDVEFFRARFLGRSLFVSRKENGRTIRIFSGTDVSFREVDIAPLDALVFRDADLQKCHFLGADLRKAEFTAVKWPEKRARLRVYDEDAQLTEGETRKWAHIEQLYRQLKQNHEDRRDYERARHFHIGEKEMRRKNSGWGLWSLLTLYRWVSGYGESSLLPLIWASVLLAATTAAYFWGGLLVLNKDANSMLSLTRIGDVGLYSLRVMTLLKPNDFIPTWFCGNFVNWIQSILGPLLFGLFALALRQRLKR